jgi:hypothetical protein
MHSLISGLSALRFSRKSVPFALVLIAALSFGLFIPTLGFYQDDWPILYFQGTGGLAGLWKLHLYQSRPLATGLYALAFALIGNQVWLWHLLTLALRVLTLWIGWSALSRLWPGHERILAWFALLFAVYPLFLLQPLSVTYLIHWAGFALFTASVWFMVRAFQSPQRHGLYLTASALFTAGHLFVIEYYAGLELARPLLLWFLLPSAGPIRARLVRLARASLLHGVALAVFVSYRIAWLPRPFEGFDQNPPQMLFDFLEAPLATLAALLGIMLKDSVHILLSTWANVFTVTQWDLSRPVDLVAIAAAVLAGVGAFHYVKRLRQSPLQDRQDSKAPRQMFWLGLSFTVLGPLPAWVTYQTITANNLLWSNRFGLGSMLGAALIFAAGVSIVVRVRYRGLVLSLLIGFTVAFHLISANDYRWSATKQAQFYQQLHWRAPYIEPGTAIFSDGELFGFMGEYPTSFALGLLYHPEQASTDVPPYWFFSLNKHFSSDYDSLVAGVPVSSRTYSASFQGNSKRALVIYFEPELNQCLWVLSPDDAAIEALPRITRDVAAISNLNRIRSRAPSDLDLGLFNTEMSPNWCYYYQKADLARQFESWSEIIALWAAAQAQNVGPANGVEYLPFIHGFAHAGDWATAAELTLAAKSYAQGINPQLCTTWRQLYERTGESEERTQTIHAVERDLGCELQQ